MAAVAHLGRVGFAAPAIAAGSAGGPVGLAVGLAVTGVTFALQAIFARKGPRQRVASTSIVNDLEPQLQANLDGYFSGPRTPESQAAALANFDAAWQFLVSSQACGSPDLGNPGRACIADRSRGGRWDWASYYRDPIAADVPVPTGSSAAAIALQAELPSWAWPVGLILLGVLL